MPLLMLSKRKRA